jgi:hypothetical protein
MTVNSWLLSKCAASRGNTVRGPSSCSSAAFLMGGEKARARLDLCVSWKQTAASAAKNVKKTEAQQSGRARGDLGVRGINKR